MKSGINTSCFDEKISLNECFEIAYQAGFDGIEINMEEESKDKLNLHINFTLKELESIRELSERYNIKILSISTSLLWKYPLTDNDNKKRKIGKNIIKRMIEAAKFLNVDTVLVVPGVVTDEVSYDMAFTRVCQIIHDLKEFAEQHKVYIGIENVWNKFLLSPLEMKFLIEKIGSKYVGVYFDAGNVLAFGYPEQWVSILGNHIIRVHVKDFDTSIGNINGFKQLLEGNLNFPVLINALRNIQYDSYLTAEVQYDGQGVTKFANNIKKSLDMILNM